MVNSSARPQHRGRLVLIIARDGEGMVDAFHRSHTELQIDILGHS